MRQSIKDIDIELTPYFKEAGLSIIDDKFRFTDEYDSTYQLGIFKANFGQHVGTWGIFLEGPNGEETWIGEAPREAIIMALPRIIPLLEKYIGVLEQKEIEYRDIANVAEAMAETIKGQ